MTTNETTGWLEKEIAQKFQLFKKGVAEHKSSWSQGSIRILSLHHEINEDLDYDDEDWEEQEAETVNLYRLGICTQNDYQYFTDKGIKPKIDWKEITTDTPYDIFWGEPSETTKFDQLWDKSYQSEQKFSKFLRCLILAKVALLLKRDAETAPFFSNDVVFIINIEFNYYTPVFDTEVPSLDIRQQIAEEIASDIKNQELLVSLWDTTITGAGLALLNELKIEPKQ